MQIRKRVLTPDEQAMFENAIAQTERNKANIDYIAMMTDIEIPTDEEDEYESEI